MKIHITIYTALLFLLVVGLTGQVKAQSPCQDAFNQVNSFGGLVQFGIASGSGHFKDLVDASSFGITLSTCDSIAPQAWDELIRIGTDAQSSPANYVDNLKAGALVAIFAYGPQVDLTRLKEFAQLEPWNTNLTFASHLTIDALLELNNDSAQDKAYRTYTFDEMLDAFQKYGN